MNKMLISPRDLKLVDAASAPLGTVLISTRNGWSHLFQRAILISGGSHFEDRALLALDGEYAMHFLKLTSGEEDVFRVLPAKELLVDVDVSPSNVWDQSPGSLAATTAGPSLAVRFLSPQGRPSFGISVLDLSTWTLAETQPRQVEIIPAWRLLAKTEDGSEPVVLYDSVANAAKPR